MAQFVALLRAVNVGGSGKIAMKDLAAHFRSEGYANVRTLLATGNVFFETDLPGGVALEEKLRTNVREQLGLDTDFFVRDAAEWRSIVAANPFPRESQSDPAHLVVLLLKSAPSTESVSRLRDAIRGREYLEVTDTTGYVVYPDGIGDSRLTVSIIERQLGTRVTGRNWNTVRKIELLFT